MEIFLIALMALMVILLLTSVRVVRQGYVYTIERLGRFTKPAQPGLHLIVPLVDRVGHKINMMEQVLDIPGQEIITKDNAMAGVDAVVFFQVLEAGKAAYEVSNLHHALMALTTTNLRTVMGSMDLDETLSRRDEINARLLNVVDHATSPWGVKITRVEIKDIRPPIDISEAMARQMKAERLKRAEILEAEGDRASNILRAEGDKQSAILKAEGKREAAFRDAEARERAAEAEAKATQMVSDAIAESGNQAINYFIAQEYTRAIGKFADSPNAKTILFPVEATQLVGSLGGIGELLRDAVTPPASIAPPRGGGGGGGSGGGSGPRQRSERAEPRSSAVAPAVGSTGEGSPQAGSPGPGPSGPGSSGTASSGPGTTVSSLGAAMPGVSRSSNPRPSEPRLSDARPSRLRPFER